MAVIVVIFLTTNITSAILIHHQKLYHHSLPLFILVIRVSINGALFLLAAIALSACIYKMRTTSSSNMILEAKVNVWHDLGLQYIYCIRLCQYIFLLKMISMRKSFIIMELYEIVNFKDFSKSQGQSLYVWRFPLLIEYLFFAFFFYCLFCS